jgi:uncharacterized membrane protein
MARWILSIFFVAAGLNHFRDPAFYRPMMPGYLPAHETLILISGCFEILGGLGLLVPQVRKVAGIGLILLLIAVFPANLHMALHEVPVGSIQVSSWILWVRLPFQGVFIFWVWWVSLRTNAPRTS